MLAAFLRGLDLVGHRTGVAALGRQVVLVLAALLVLFLLRMALDQVARGVGPFAPVYPVVLVATLLGRLRAGLMAWLACIAFVAFVTLPGGSPVFVAPGGVALTLINSVSTLFVVLMTEGAQIQASGLLAEREARIAERDTLLEEVDHRLKNNLAMLTGLLGLQLRETSNDEAREIIARTATRLQSLSKVYESLRYEPGTVTVLNAAVLIEQLCVSLRDALGLDGDVVLEVASTQVLVTRDRASAIALLLNEIVTNAAKHAFAGRDRGRIKVELSRSQDGGAMLAISDDGQGIRDSGENSGSGGRGRRLLNALAEMAGGELGVVSGKGGTRYELVLKRLP